MAPEVFTINYAMWLPMDVWPSDSQRNSLGQPMRVPVWDMPPQQAAAALAKLVRWARGAPAGDLASVAAVDDRENVVRDSRLGQCLSARALSLPDVEHVYALYHQAGDLPDRPDEADNGQVLATIYDALHRANPLANPADLVATVTAVGEDLIAGYDIYELET